jgi:hypothetical protein
MIAEPGIPLQVIYYCNSCAPPRAFEVYDMECRIKKSVVR